jgi:hypothetical protein
MTEMLLMPLLAIAAIVATVAVILFVVVGGFLGLSAAGLLAGIAAALPQWEQLRRRR